MGIRVHNACAHEKSTLYRDTKCFLVFLVGPAGVEPTTNGLKVLNSVPLSATLSTCFSVDKKWCASFCVVCTAGKMKTLYKGILTMPVIRVPIIFQITTFHYQIPVLLRHFVPFQRHNTLLSKATRKPLALL
jgi:hypothetical protein